jgi:hypothetical protein
MNHIDILVSCINTSDGRAGEYGSPADTFDKAAKMAAVVLGRPFSARDIVMVMVLVKLSRMHASPNKLDHYVDAINYLAFAAEFVTEANK